MEKIATTLYKYFDNNDIREPERPVENIIFVGNDYDVLSSRFTIFDCHFRNCEFRLYSAYGYDVGFVDCIFENCVFYEDSIFATFSRCIFLNNLFPQGFRHAFYPKTNFLLFNYDDSFLESLSEDMNCPSSGEFVGWKKAYLCKRFKDSIDIKRHHSIGIKMFPVIVKLLIPSKSRRSSGLSNKCRCEKAMVLEVQTEDGRKIDISEEYIVVSMYEFKSMRPRLIVSMDDLQTRYIPGEMVYPDMFNPDPLIECGGGIHFFMTREEALNYDFY